MSATRPHTVSVIICTYNRVESLRRTLESLEQQNTDGFEHEWIVVDNNSTDQTPQFLAEYAKSQPRLRVLHETRQGKSHALNRGITAVRGDIVAFTDDDIRLPPDWLQRIVELYDARGAAGVGGRVVLDDDQALPVWLHRQLVVYLGLHDEGEGIMEVHPPGTLIGANMSVRKDVLDAVGGFDTALGPQGRNYASPNNEDVEFCHRVARLGVGPLIYSSDVVAYHEMMPEKLTRAYFRQRAWGEGIGIIFRNAAYSKGSLPADTLRLVYRSLRLAAGWLKNIGHPDERFLREFRFIWQWSALVARFRGLPNRKASLPR
jgi:glycosyltransferase involved in cell wall biosynthesis